VLQDDEAASTDDSRRDDVCKRAGSITLVYEHPRRISENHVERVHVCKSLRHSTDVESHHMRPFFEIQRLHIRTQRRKRIARRLYESRVRCAARKRFEAQRSSSGVEVEDPRAFDGASRAEDAEESLAYTVGRRPSRGSARSGECARLMNSACDAHWIRYRGRRHVPALRFSLMTSPMSRAFTLLSVLVTNLVVSRTVWGEPPVSKATPVYVLSIWTDDADDQADALTQALRGRVRQAPGWSLLQTSQSFETLAIALKCPPKPDFPCLQRIGDQLKADHYFWGTMDRKKAPAGYVSAELHLWTRVKPDTVARQNYADNLKDPNDESLRAIAADLFTKLAPALAPPPIAAADVPPARGPSGSERQTPAVAIATFPTARSTAPDRFPMRTVIAYSAVVVGGGLLVASIVEAANWISDSDRSTEDRKQVPKSVTDVCADSSSSAAKDACSSSKDAVTASTLGWLFAGLGAALVGTGVWLITSEETSRKAPGDEVSSGSERRVTVLPSFGPRATSLELNVTF
jgi:hypothetical protein